MSLLNRTKPEFALRLSLAVMYCYSGWSLFKTPTSWTQFVPLWLKSFLTDFNFPVAAFVQIQGVVELVFAAILILWFLPGRLVKWVAIISTIEMALILWFNGIDLITFRDIGVLGASFALFLLYQRRGD